MPFVELHRLAGALVDHVRSSTRSTSAAVDAEIGVFHTSASVRSSTRAVVIERRLDHVRLHHHAAVGDGAGDHRHVQRHHRGAALPEAADGQQRQLIGEVGDLAEAAGRRRRAGRSAASRRCPTSWCRRPSPPARARWPSGRTGCCSCGRRPRPSCRRTPCRRSSGSGRWSAAARTRVSTGNDAVERGDAVLEGDDGRDDLEARARHVPLLVRVGQQRLAGQCVEERQHVSGLAVLCTATWSGS